MTDSNHDGMPADPCVLTYIARDAAVSAAVVVDTEGVALGRSIRLNVGDGLLDLVVTDDLAVELAALLLLPTGADAVVIDCNLA